MAQTDRWASSEGDFFAFAASGPPFLDVRGFDVNCRLELFRTDKDSKEYRFKTKKGEYRLVFSSKGGKIQVYQGAEAIIEINLSEALPFEKNTALQNFEIPQKTLTFSAQNQKARVRLYVFNVSGRKTEKEIQIYYLKSDLLFSDT